MYNNAFFIPSNINILKVLADEYISKYKDSVEDVIFVLPNSRACNSLQEMIILQSNFTSIKMPHMISISSIDNLQNLIQ